MKMKILLVGEELEKVLFQLGIQMVIPDGSTGILTVDTNSLSPKENELLEVQTSHEDEPTIQQHYDFIQGAIYRPDRADIEVRYPGFDCYMPESSHNDLYGRCWIVNKAGQVRADYAHTILVRRDKIEGRMISNTGLKTPSLYTRTAES